MRKSICALAFLAFPMFFNAAWAAPRDLSAGIIYWTDSVESENKSDYQQALTALTGFRQSTGEDYLADLRSGWLNYQAKNYDAAITSYRRASSAFPNAIAPLLGQANCYTALKNIPEASRLYEQVLNRRPPEYTSSLMLASFAFQNGDYRRAAQYYGPLVQSYPEDKSVLSGYGWSQLYLGNKRDSSEAFRRLLILSNEYPGAREGYEKASGDKLNLAAQ